MSTDVHQGSPQAAFGDIPAADEQFDPQTTWAETMITAVAAVVTVVFVSFVAVLMAMS
jgi:hypothetical protein